MSNSTTDLEARIRLANWGGIDEDGSTDTDRLVRLFEALLAQDHQRKAKCSKCGYEEGGGDGDKD